MCALTMLVLYTTEWTQMDVGSLKRLGCGSYIFLTWHAQAN